MKTMLLIAAVVIVAFVLLRQIGGSKRAAPVERHLPVAQVSMSLSHYDPNAYRFDGRAVPQFAIAYGDEDGVVTERDIYVHEVWNRRDHYKLDSWCFLRDQRRSFRSDRILEARNLATGRRINDIRAYMYRG